MPLYEFAAKLKNIKVIIKENVNETNIRGTLCIFLYSLIINLINKLLYHPINFSFTRSRFKSNVYFIGSFTYWEFAVIIFA